MHYRIGIMAGAAAVLVVAACADQEGGRWLGTEPGEGAPTVRYETRTSAAVVNPKTHRLETVTAGPVASGVSASVVGVSVTTDGLQVALKAPGVAYTAGSASWTFTDSTMHVHKIVFLYRVGGGPPAAMQHYTDGKLVSTTAYSWTKTSSGWARTRSYMQSVRNGVLVGTYTTTSVVRTTSGGYPQTVRLDRPPAVSPLQRALGSIAYAAAFAFAPQDATAQGFYFYACRQQWLRYAGAAAVLAGAAAALAAAPELTPILITTFIGALATTAALEDALIDCMIANDSLASGGFGSGTGGSAGSGGVDDSCLEGSYAAHCTTAFTL